MQQQAGILPSHLAKCRVEVITVEGFCSSLFSGSSEMSGDSVIHRK